MVSLIFSIISQFLISLITALCFYLFIHSFPHVYLYLCTPFSVLPLGWYCSFPRFGGESFCCFILLFTNTFFCSLCSAIRPKLQTFNFDYCFLQIPHFLLVLPYISCFLVEGFIYLFLFVSTCFQSLFFFFK